MAAPQPAVHQDARGPPRREQQGQRRYLLEEHRRLQEAACPRLPVQPAPLALKAEQLVRWAQAVAQYSRPFGLQALCRSRLLVREERQLLRESLRREIQDAE